MLLSAIENAVVVEDREAFLFVRGKRSGSYLIRHIHRPTQLGVRVFLTNIDPPVDILSLAANRSMLLPPCAVRPALAGHS